MYKLFKKFMMKLFSYVETEKKEDTASEVNEPEKEEDEVTQEDIDACDVHYLFFATYDEMKTIEDKIDNVVDNDSGMVPNAHISLALDEVENIPNDPAMYDIVYVSDKIEDREAVFDLFTNAEKKYKSLNGILNRLKDEPKYEGKKYKKLRVTTV